MANSGRGKPYLSKAIGPAKAGPARFSSLERRTELARTSSKRKAERPGARSTFRASTSSNRTRPGGRDAGAVWRQAVLDLWFPGRDDDSEPVPCPVTGRDMRYGWHCHHVLEADLLWSHRVATDVLALPHPRTGEVVEAPAVWHPFIGLPMAAQGHMDHTNGALEIPVEVIPSWTWQLVALLNTLDPLAGEQWATERMRRDYR